MTLIAQDSLIHTFSLYLALPLPSLSSLLPVRPSGIHPASTLSCM